MNRSSYYSKIYLPLAIGFSIGLIIHLKTLTFSQNCKETINGEPRNEDLKNNIKRTNNQFERPATVKAKPSRFNNDYRPYFVYSELGFKNLVFVGVKTTEEQLLTYGIAINNTWVPDFHNVVFFTPYSMNEDFHNRFIKKMNLNIVQLPDIVEGSSDLEFSLRILQYMKDHFLHKFNWFIMVNDNVYVNFINTVEFLKTLNSTKPIVISNSAKRYDVRQCDTSNGIMFSHAALYKISAQTCGPNTGKFSQVISCLSKWFDLKCNGEHFFQNDQTVDFSSLVEDKQFRKAMTISPINSIKDFFLVHKIFVKNRLDTSFEETHTLQSCIKEFHERLPNDVPEKKLHWPIGYPRPFRPSSRFEVLQWNYFDKQHLYGFSDAQPVSSFDPSYFKDFSEILRTVKRALHRKYKRNTKLELINGYHRIDPRRGAEYIIDMKTYLSGGDVGQIDRFQLLRPFSRVESLSMPAATEQKGIHLVLPVLKDDILHFEKFLQMYKRICLQTGENVVLLTVFINIREGRFEGEDKEDPFIDFKHLIARYKQSYMWAQLPWLQVGITQVSPVLIMDIVSMKLPSNALIFLLTRHTHFTVNFLNRCRVNVINGIQVFFPIPFMEYNPDTVYINKQKPAFSEVHITTGTWDRFVQHVGCFCNNDYKEVRMWKKDFLDEKIRTNQTILNVFQTSRLHVFRAIDSELRTRFNIIDCQSDRITNNITQCQEQNAEKLGNRRQLAQILFQNKYTP